MAVYGLPVRKLHIARNTSATVVYTTKKNPYPNWHNVRERLYRTG